jgi:abortive infection bacteriophage resistance protein
MKFPDPEYARRCLLRIGYYRLSAYWYPLRKFCLIPGEPESVVRCDGFKQDTDFDQVIKFYLFDKSMRLTLLDALERIEIAFRAAIVEVLGEDGPQAHRDERSYKSKFSKADEDGLSPLSKFMDGQDQQFKRSKEEFAKHFQSKYEGCPPIWIMAGTWGWGNLTHTIANLSDRNKLKISKIIHPDLPMKNMASWVTCLNEVRNTCAHHSRLWNKPLINSPGIPRNGLFPEFDHLRVQSEGVSGDRAKRLYGALVTMIFLMKCFHPKTEWHIRLKEQIQEVDLPSEVSLASAGFRDGWQRELVWN